MGFQPIENYGAIGNMSSVTLVGLNGSIDSCVIPTSTRLRCLLPCSTMPSAVAIRLKRTSIACEFANSICQTARYVKDLPIRKPHEVYK